MRQKSCIAREFKLTSAFRCHKTVYLKEHSSLQPHRIMKFLVYIFLCMTFTRKAEPISDDYDQQSDWLPKAPVSTQCGMTYAIRLSQELRKIFNFFRNEAEKVAEEFVSCQRP
jgi:hypothetical protein